MSEFFKKDGGIILLLIFLFFVILPFFYLHQGLLLIDTGREFYIPSQMLKGEVLYKDIYNIYGAFSYQLNALLFALFGQKITVLYNAGVLNSLLIIITIYLLSREFLNKAFSFLFAVMIMFALVFPVFLYNSVLTYTFAVVYALSSFLLSVLFLIKYIKKGGNFSAYLACLFAGISISNKYEFILYPFILVYVLIFLRPIGLKNALKCLGSFLIIPLISYGLLFIQGLNLSDIKDNQLLLRNLINAPLLKLFFLKTGVFFNVSYIRELIFRNKIFALFAFMPLLNLLFSAVYFRKIYKNKALFILILCSVISCAKTFFYLNVNHMGVFMFPVCALVFFILISEQFKKEAALIILFACILIFGAEDFSGLKDKNFLLETPKGTLYTYKKDGSMIKQVYDYIITNTKPEDKVVIMPEGSIINFLSGRRGDSYYYNLSPLFYKDVFGEERILKHFKNNPGEYIVILPIDNIEYGSRFFGLDYAHDFYNMIINGYDLREEKNGIKIFKRKNIE